MMASRGDLRAGVAWGGLGDGHGDWGWARSCHDPSTAPPAQRTRGRLRSGWQVFICGMGDCQDAV